MSFVEMKCLFCVKYSGDERHRAHINLSHHTYQEDLQYTDWDLCLKSLSLCNSGSVRSWRSIAKLKLIKNSHVNQLSSLWEIRRRVLLPFQKTAQGHRTSYIKLAEAHLQHGHGGSYRSSSPGIHLQARTLVNQLLFGNEMQSDSFFLRVRREPKNLLLSCLPL